MKAEADWQVVPDADALHHLTGVRREGEWCAVAVPDLVRPRVVLVAAWEAGVVWGCINILGPVGAKTLCQSVKQFHQALRETGVDQVFGLRAAHASARWMEWLGAVPTGETVDGEEVWVWRN
jgi:hypothetical protein